MGEQYTHISVPCWRGRVHFCAVGDADEVVKRAQKDDPLWTHYAYAIKDHGDGCLEMVQGKPGDRPWKGGRFWWER